MIDPVIASRIAQMEHEERMRALIREEQLLNDILPDEYAIWATRTAGNGHVRHVGNLLSSVGKNLVSLVNSLIHRQEGAPNRAITGRRRRGIAG